MPDDLRALAARAGVPDAVAEHYGPLVALVGALLDERDRGRPPGDDAAPASPLSIETGRLYSAAEANALLGFGGPGPGPKRMTIYEIPAADLPRCKVGPARGSLRFLGADLLAYAKGLPPGDLAGLLDDARQQLHDRMSRPSVVAGAVGEATGRRRRIV